MGLWDSIKDIGHSFRIKSNLCNKSWLQIDDSGDRITYIFKSNNQLHLTKNGLSQIVPWKYFPENERLVIYYNNNEGMSFQYTFIEKGVLLYLKADQGGNLLILANERVEKAPKSVSDLGLFFKKINASRVSSALKKVSYKYDEENNSKQIASILDSVLDECDNKMLVENINYFKEAVAGFDVYYHAYLRDYQLERDYDLSFDIYDLEGFDKMFKLRKIIPSLYRSKKLDSYIDYVGDRIEYDKITNRYLDDWLRYKEIANDPDSNSSKRKRLRNYLRI